MKKATSKAKPAKAAKRGSAKRARKRQGATEAERQEQAYYLEVLKANRQLAEETGDLPPGATHRVERDESGKERIVRKRFSAL